MKKAKASKKDNDLYTVARDSIVKLFQDFGMDQSGFDSRKIIIIHRAMFDEIISQMDQMLDTKLTAEFLEEYFLMGIKSGLDALNDDPN